MLMETWHYEVVSIDGDYANLRRTDIDSDDLRQNAPLLLNLLIISSKPVDAHDVEQIARLQLGGCLRHAGGHLLWQGGEI
mgnify:CR=1 FL=1